MDDTYEYELSEKQQANNALITWTARPIIDWVERPEVSEIAINRPKEVWLKLRKPDENQNVWIRRQDENLTRQYMENLLHLLANTGNTPEFGPQGTPIVYGALPGIKYPYNHRFVGGYGYNLQYYNGETDIAGTTMFVCRQTGPDRKISFEDYGLVRGQELEPYDLVGDRRADGSDPIQRIINSINRGDHILLSGPVDTGKTTLMNEMLSRMSEKLRIITLQDSPEIRLRQENHLHIMMGRQGLTNQFTYKSVVDLIVRSTADVIVAGEISTTNAATIWELCRSGHGNFMTSIHAEDLLEATSTFVTRIGHTNPAEVQDRVRVIDEMMTKFRIIQLSRDPRTNVRKIVQIN
jgi:type IV secretion system protein VirB11